jgi:hypothetical protein
MYTIERERERERSTRGSGPMDVEKKSMFESDLEAVNDSIQDHQSPGPHRNHGHYRRDVALHAHGLVRKIKPKGSWTEREREGTDPQIPNDLRSLNNQRFRGFDPKSRDINTIAWWLYVDSQGSLKGKFSFLCM